MKITQDLAYLIIRKLEGTMDHNINIIDENGVIIASTDSNRLESIHEGAKQVLQTKKPLIVYPKDITQFSGTREGVNLPIEFMDDIIGVVGITGDPEMLMQLAQMTKITVELILQHDYLQKQDQFEQQLMQSWTLEVIGPDPVNEEKLAKHAKHFLHIDLQKEYVVFLIEFPISDTSNSLEDLMKTNELREEIFRYVHLGFEDVKFSGITNENLLFFGIILRNSKSEFEIADKIDRLLRAKNKQQFSDCKVAVGNRNTTIKGIRHSYFEARQSLDLMRKFKSNNNTSHIKDWGLIRLLDQVPVEIQSEFLTQYPIGNLPIDLLETLNVLLECDHNLTLTASKLHIHRNTLAYRLESIHQLLKLNPKSVNDLSLLLVLTILQKLHISN